MTLALVVVNDLSAARALEAGLSAKGIGVTHDPKERVDLCFASTGLATEVRALRVVVGPLDQVFAELETIAVDFLATPFAPEEVGRLAESLNDVDACEEAVALLGVGARGTLEELRVCASKPVVILTGEPGTGIGGFARWLAALRGRAYVVVEAANLTDEVTLSLQGRGVTAIVNHLERVTERAALIQRMRSLTTSVPVIATWQEISGPLEAGRDFGELQPAVVHVAPVRERVADIVSWVHVFERIFSLRRHCDVCVPPRPLSAMRSYRWPNNLPELRATVDSLCLSDEPRQSRGGSGEYRVPVQRELVRIHTCSGGVREAYMFWPTEVEFLASLEAGDPFFPAEFNGEIVIFARANVEAFGIEQSRDSVAWGVGVMPKTVRAELRLRSGAILEGEFVYSAEHSRARLVDHLNGGAHFILFRSGRELLHVSKAHIDFVEEMR